jgi:putative tryptophan/tyrosine transport system substrate-binding protein
MRRRDLIMLVGGAAATWPLVVSAQQTERPVIGMLLIGTPTSYDLSGFHRGLKDAGFVEGQNLAIDYRWANNDPNGLPALAADLVRRQVRIIAVIASSLPVRAAMSATNTIPIVFGFGNDPVQMGIVASLNRPGGNVTGATAASTELVGKRLGLLHDLVPQAVNFGLLNNPTNTAQEAIIKDARAAASLIGGTIEVLNASTSDEIDVVFNRLADEKRLQGLLVSNDALFNAQRFQLAQAMARNLVPAIYASRAQAEAGGLMSYGPNLAERDREVGHYVGRIINGEKPADLPVVQSNKFELVINRKTAKALGLTLPPGLLSIADEVIE